MEADCGPWTTMPWHLPGGEEVCLGDVVGELDGRDWRSQQQKPKRQTVQAELHSESPDHQTLPEGTLESKQDHQGEYS